MTREFEDLAGEHGECNKDVRILVWPCDPTALFGRKGLVLEKTPEPASLSRNNLLIALALFALTCLFGTLRMAPGVIGAYHDDGIYVATSKGLAEGLGYVLPNLPVVLPQTKYPPLLSYLFVPVWKVAPHFPRNAVYFQAICLFLSAIASALTYLFLIRFRYSSQKVALAAVAIAISSSEYLFFSTLPLSEGPFTLLAICSFWALEETVRRPERVRIMACLSGLLLGLAFLCRTIGVLWVIVALALFIKSKRAALVPFAVVALPPIMLWFSWSASNTPTAFDPLFEYYVTYAQDWAGVTLTDLPRILALNVLWSFRGLGYNLFFGSIVALSLAKVPFLVVGMIVAFLALSHSLKLIRSGRMLPFFLLAYFIPVIVHPWPPGRFIIPVSLLGGAFFLAEASQIMKKLWPRLSLLPSALIVSCIALNLVVLAATHLHIREHGYPGFIGAPPRWASFEEGFRWIRSNTPRDAIIAASLDPMVWLYTNRRSFRYFNQQALHLYYDKSKAAVDGPQQILDNLHRIGASFLFLSPQYGFAIDRQIREQVLSLANQPNPAISPVFTSGDGVIAIYAVVPPANLLEKASIQPIKTTPARLSIAEGADHSRDQRAWPRKRT